MPSNYNFTENGVVYNFDDVFVPRDIFDTTAVGGPGNFTVSGQDIEDYFITEYQLIDDYVGDTLWVWGSNGSGRLGVNNTITRSTPVTTLLGGTNWKSVSGGGAHTIAIKTDGTLWTWGSNGYGQLGNNSISNVITPVTTLLGGTNWKSVSGGGAHTIAIKTDGTLWTWGRNDSGRLGINNTISRSTPVTTILGGNNWKSVDGGNQFTSAIKTDGTLWVWGRNLFGQLGVNNTTDRSTPVTTILGGTNWKSVSSGGYYMTAIKTDGTLWTWGDNFYAQLGVNDTTQRNTPVTTILGGNNWKFVDCGFEHTIAIKTDGTLWAWGRNGYGQLGINDIITRSTPVTTILGGTNWKSASSGLNSSVAIKTDGTLWTWGRNNSAQLGVNNAISRSTPVTTILGGTNWKSSSLGSSSLPTDTVHVMALTAGESVDFS